MTPHESIERDLAEAIGRLTFAIKEMERLEPRPSNLLRLRGWARNARELAKLALAKLPVPAARQD